MTQAERKAAQAALQTFVGTHTRALTDALNQAATDALYPDGLPEDLRRVLNQCQLAAHKYDPPAET